MNPPSLIRLIVSCTSKASSTLSSSVASPIVEGPAIASISSCSKACSAGVEKVSVISLLVVLGMVRKEVQHLQNSWYVGKIRYIYRLWPAIDSSFRSTTLHRRIEMVKVKVAGVQAGSAAFDLKGSLDKVWELTAKAAKDGAQFVVFPEAFVSGYPRHLGFQIGSRSEEDRIWYAKYVKVCSLNL